MKRIKLAKWFDDLGHSIGLWIAPEKAEIDKVLAASDGEADGDVMMRLHDFVGGHGAQGVD